MTSPTRLFVIPAILAWSASATAADSYSPYVGRSHPTTVYWGDTHLHTSRSADAYTFGDRIDADQAYRFARGETATATNGMPVRLRRPLDFLVVADHAESLGVLPGFAKKDPDLLATEEGRQVAKHFEANDGKEATDKSMMKSMLKAVRKLWSDEFLESESFKRSVWQEVTSVADRYNDPGRFTAFIGYEWTSGIKVSGNLHRVVVFKDGADRANQVTPFSSLDSPDPEALWAYMASYEQSTGGEILAIPHNGNVSNGEMFGLNTFTGQPLTRAYAERRRRWEPLYEVTQIKGDSEAHPFLSPTDEFADYETWNSWDGKALPEGRSWNDAERSIKAGEYARSAFKRGLSLGADLGVNPYQFGLIGSTDAHTSLAAVEENNFWGKAPLTNPGPDRAAEDKMTMLWSRSFVREYSPSSDPAHPPERAWHMASSGYAAVWATENTREALFAAMKRKETYATTGPRMTVRFFGGWEYEADDALRPDLALIGYRKGVPMGGDLSRAPAGQTPRFLIRAVKDPDGANLDRVQVIKGWRDSKGAVHEAVHNVALSGDRRAQSDGKAQAVGSTVDVNNASYTNTIGAAELAAVWTDPDFDPAESAFYYARVIEIPTPRWTAYDAKFFRLRDASAQVPMVTQERAYTSPIWYTP